MDANRAEQVLIDTGITPPSAELPATPFDPSSVRKDVRAFRIDPSEYEEPAQPAPPAPVEPELCAQGADRPGDAGAGHGAAGARDGRRRRTAGDGRRQRRARHWSMPMLRP